jgi:CIC family chloride channel protein
MAYSVLVGIVGGLGAILFNVIFLFCREQLLIGVCGFTPPMPGGEIVPGVTSQPINPHPNYWIFVIPALGGLVSSLIVWFLAREAEGDGTDAVIDSFHRSRGFIRARAPLVKIIASSITVGSGGSAGREGPITLIGAGFGSILASLFHLSDRERRILIIAGVGAGVGSIFRAPLGGALFATEVLYRDAEIEYEALIPAFIASIVGYSVYCPLSGTGWHPIFTLPGVLSFSQPAALVLYAILGIVLAGFGRLWVVTYGFISRRVFRPLPVHRVFKPAIGGLVVGAIGYNIPQVLGLGYGYVQEALDGNLTISAMLLIAVAKIVATSFTVGSGGSGGVFAPSLVIGGLAGGAVGKSFSLLLPSLKLEPGAFVLVGMAGYFAGVGKVPISAMLMVSEMTMGYGLIVPLMLVVAVCFLITGERTTIYEKQVARRVDSPAHVGDFIIDIFETIKVRDICRAEARPGLIEEGTPLEEVLRLTTETTRMCYPVGNAKGELTGIIMLDDLRAAFFEPDLFPLIIARDIAVRSFPRIYLEDDLSSALRKMMESNATELPVVDEQQSSVVLCTLSRQDLIQAYHRSVRDYLSRREPVRCRPSTFSS